MKHLLYAFIPLALSGCTVDRHDVLSAGAATADAVGLPVPETTTRTTIDEKALTISAKAVSVAALSSSALSKTPLLRPGTPLSQIVARGLDDARNFINAAVIARQAGNAKSYTEALNNADAALEAVKAAIAKIGA